MTDLTQARDRPKFGFGAECRPKCGFGLHSASAVYECLTAESIRPNVYEDECIRKCRETVVPGVQHPSLCISLLTLDSHYVACTVKLDFRRLLIMLGLV